MCFDGCGRIKEWCKGSGVAWLARDDQSRRCWVIYIILMHMLTACPRPLHSHCLISLPRRRRGSSSGPGSPARRQEPVFLCLFGQQPCLRCRVDIHWATQALFQRVTSTARVSVAWRRLAPMTLIARCTSCMWRALLMFLSATGLTQCWMPVRNCRLPHWGETSA